MIISEKGDEYLITLKAYTKILTSLGVKFKENTYREHIKNGKLKNGTCENGLYAVWVQASVYNAIFKNENSCKKCREYESKLEAIHKLTT